MGHEVRTETVQGVFECDTSIRADPDAIRSGGEDVIRISRHAVDAADRIGLGKFKAEPRGLPILPPIRCLHEADPVGAAEVRIARGREKVQWIFWMKGHIGHSHASPIRCAEQGPIVA